jgi:hypothetical protein
LHISGPPMSGTGAGKDGAQAADGRYPGPMAYAGLGMLNAVCLLGGCLLGWLADRALGTLPLFLFVGLVGGAALGVLGTRAELRRYNR